MINKKIKNLLYKIKTNSNFEGFCLTYGFLFSLVLGFIIVIGLINIISPKITFKNYINFIFNGLDIQSLKTLISIGVTLFGTMLALYWTIIISFYNKIFSDCPIATRPYFFKLAHGRLITFFTCLYIISNFALYLSIDYKLIPKQFYTNIFTVWFCYTSYLLIYFSYISIIIFFRIDINAVCLEIIKRLGQKIQIAENWHNKFLLFPTIDEVHNTLLLFYEILTKNIDKFSSNDQMRFLSNNNEILEKYWKIKKTIYYDSDWHFLTQQSKSLSETLFTGSNTVITRDLMYIERWFFDINTKLISSLITNKNFFVINLYLNEIRKILFLKEKENLFTFNIPFFNETLTILLAETNKNFNKILIDSYTKENEKNITFYEMISTLNIIIGNIFMMNQAYLFKFNKSKITATIPSYKEIQQIQTIQDLLLKYPVINHKIGLITYSKLFIEKKVENNIITSEEQFFKECNLPIIQMELVNILNLFQSIEYQLTKNLTYFTVHENPHYFFDTFLTFISIKYKLLINLERYQTIYAEYFTNSEEIQKKLNKIQSLFNFYEKLPNQLTKIIKIYHDENYFSKKEFPNILNDTFQTLLHLLEFYFKYENKNFKLEKIDTIKFSFDFMLTIHKILIMESNIPKISPNLSNEEQVSISYLTPFVAFACIIGLGIQKDKNNMEDINVAFKELLQQDEIKNYLKSFIANRNKYQYYFQQIAMLVEQKIHAQNTLQTFFYYINQL